MTIQNSLTKLGLNKNQISVYLRLLESGKSQAGPIIKSTGLHRMQVYEAFEELKNLGLVTIVQEKTVQFFEAASPSNLVEAQQEKLDIAQLASKELLQSFTNIPQLEIKQLSGSDGLLSNLITFIHSCADSKDKVLRMIGGASDQDFYEALGDNYKHYSALTEQYKIKKRLLGPAEQIKQTSARFTAESRSETKILPPSFNHPVYTRICPEYVSIEFYKPQIAIIQIKNSIIASSYIANFDLIWDSI